MGLAGVAESAGVVVGPHRASVGRVAGLFGQVARVAGADDRSTVPGAGLGAGHPGSAVCTPVAEERTASRQELVSYRGNRWLVPPELAMSAVTGTHPVGGLIAVTTTAGSSSPGTNGSSAAPAPPRRSD